MQMRELTRRHTTTIDFDRETAELPSTVTNHEVVDTNSFDIDIVRMFVLLDIFIVAIDNARQYR
jgi:hypothetical protein